MRSKFYLFGALAAAVACSNTTASNFGDAAPDDAAGPPRCIPGASAACACVNGRFGAQRCHALGAFDPCICAASAEDAGVGLPRCVPGTTMACFCTSGRSGAQVCRADGTYATCACDAPPVDAGVPDRPAADVAPEAARDVPAPPGDVAGEPSVQLSAGSDTLVNVFAVPEGVIVVRSGAVALVARNGTEIRRWTPPREITAAAFDGTHLAVADRAMLNVLSPGLEMRGMGSLTDTCATGVIVSGPRFVCGPTADWDRVFYVHDLPSGRQLGRATPRTYQGTPMRRVPGRDDFTTVTTNSSPADVYLHRVTPEHGVTAFGDSPYHGDFSVTDTYAFVGDPATHVVTVGGVMLQIYTPTCAMTSGGRGACFMRDGTIGTLRAGERFVALTEVSPTAIAALVETASAFDSICRSGCALQRVDVTTRTVASTRTHTLTSAGRVVVARYDSYADRLLLAYTSGDRFSMMPGHVLVSLAF